MKTVKSALIKANLKRVRKNVRAESSAYLAAPPKGRACHPREGGASQPHFDDFEALTSSQGVLYLKNSASTIIHLLHPFQKLEKGYGRNLHGFSADIVWQYSSKSSICSPRGSSCRLAWRLASWSARASLRRR